MNSHFFYHSLYPSYGLLCSTDLQRNDKNVFFKGAVPMETTFFLKSLSLFHCVPLYVLQAVYQLSGPVCKATWNGCPSYSASYFHFTHCD